VDTVLPDGNQNVPTSWCLHPRNRKEVSEMRDIMIAVALSDQVFGRYLVCLREGNSNTLSAAIRQAKGCRCRNLRRRCVALAGLTNLALASG